MRPVLVSKSTLTPSCLSLGHRGLEILFQNQSQQLTKIPQYLSQQLNIQLFVNPQNSTNAKCVAIHTHASQARNFGQV